MSELEASKGIHGPPAGREKVGYRQWVLGRLISYPTPQPQWSQTELYKFFLAGFPVGSVSSKDPHPSNSQFQ